MDLHPISLLLKICFVSVQYFVFVFVFVFFFCFFDYGVFTGAFYG